MHQDILEAKDTIKDIQEDLNTREEEILRVRIRIRQADMERERLEQESQALRKQIGKITRGKQNNKQGKGGNGAPGAG
jgi:regulator of replication initiation timing